MFSWIGRLFGARTAVEKQRENPIVGSVVQTSAEVYSRIPLCDFIGEERRAELARELYLEVNRICNSTEPASACREKYAAAMLETASYQVLVIRPAPEDDSSSLRGLPGITGELNAHLVDLFKRNDHLRTVIYGEEGVKNHADYSRVVQRLYWESYWLLETLNAARIALGDSVDDGDWDNAFLHAASVNAEHAYRWDLELPPAFDKDVAKEAANAYSMFTDIVMSGARDPVAEWRNYYQGRGIPMPEFETQ